MATRSSSGRCALISILRLKMSPLWLSHGKERGTGWEGGGVAASSRGLILTYIPEGCNPGGLRGVLTLGPGGGRPLSQLRSRRHGEPPEGVDHPAEGAAAPIGGGEVEDGGESGLILGFRIGTAALHRGSQPGFGPPHRLRVGV